MRHRSVLPAAAFALSALSFPAASHAQNICRIDFHATQSKSGGATWNKASTTISKTEDGFALAGVDAPVTSKMQLREIIVSSALDTGRLPNTDFALRLEGFGVQEARELVGEIEIALMSKQKVIAGVVTKSGATKTEISDTLRRFGHWDRARVEVVDSAGVAQDVASVAKTADAVEVRIGLHSLKRSSKEYISIKALNMTPNESIIQKIVALVKKVLGLADENTWTMERTLIELKREMRKANISTETFEIKLHEEAMDTIVVDLEPGCGPGQSSQFG